MFGGKLIREIGLLCPHNLNRLLFVLIRVLLKVVWWEVADTPLSVSPAQYDRLVKMTTTYADPKTCEVQTAASPLDGSTNRPVAQDLSGRKVQRICPVPEGSMAQAGVPMVSSVSSSPVLAEAIPTELASTAQGGQQSHSLLASTMPRQFADDYDPYAGL